MKYKNTVCGRFVDRPNRFIANVELGGKSEVCHVKNTGRCRELLIKGAEVYLERSENTERKTKYDLIAVRKGEMLVNMDSQAPNKVAAEYLKEKLEGLISLRAEVKYGASRFDFYAETDFGGMFVEVKGVTLERDGAAMFPDAPTQRGIKHINELIRCLSDGYGAMMLFVVQMENMRYFTPNAETNPEFAAALKKADEAGVVIKAVQCRVTPSTLTAEREIPVKL